MSLGRGTNRPDDQIVSSGTIWSSAFKVGARFTLRIPRHEQMTMFTCRQVSQSLELSFLSRWDKSLNAVIAMVADPCLHGISHVVWAIDLHRRVPAIFWTDSQLKEDLLRVYFAEFHRAPFGVQN